VLIFFLCSFKSYIFTQKLFDYFSLLDIPQILSKTSSYANYALYKAHCWPNDLDKGPNCSLDDPRWTLWLERNELDSWNKTPLKLDPVRGRVSHFSSPI